MPILSIIMPCYNRAHDLQRVLEAYDCQTTQEPFELIAVDDCSKDATFQILSSYQPAHYQLKVERLEKNSGPAAARNKGIPLVQSPCMAFVGDDILPSIDFVQGHIDAHRRYPQKEIAILGKVHWPDDFPCNTLMTHIDGIGAQQFSYHYLVDGQEYDFRHLYTANVSLKTEFVHSFKKWFDTDFIFAAFEDAEFSYRLSKRGLKIIYQAGIVAAHYHYHTIWTFSERQYKSGLMALVLVRKHPELNYLFRAPVKQLFSLILANPNVLFHKWTDAEVNWVETLAYRLASFYEWNDHILLDAWYLKVLQYGYFAGVLQGMFPGPLLKPKVRALYCMNFLLPELLSMANRMKFTGIPLPEIMEEGDLVYLKKLSNCL